MFDRVKYKKFAKVQLKGRWTVPVLITLTLMIIEFLFNIPDFMHISIDELKEMFTNPEVAASISAQTNSTTALSLVSVFVAFIFTYAEAGVYLKMSRSPDPVNYGMFIEGFANFWRALLIGLWQFLWIFLWSLLLFIPGIIKSIAYSQMIYLGNEYPEIGTRKLMKISMIITKGHKGDLFVMYLSFIGWGVLNLILTLGIGSLWLTPYINMSMTNAYHAMLKEALETGRLRMEDLQ